MRVKLTILFVAAVVVAPAHAQDRCWPDACLSMAAYISRITGVDYDTDPHLLKGTAKAYPLEPGEQVTQPDWYLAMNEAQRGEFEQEFESRSTACIEALLQQVKVHENQP